MKVKKLPVNDKSNGWSKIIPTRSPNPHLKNHVDCDWLVVGAGFAGLTAARKLAMNNPSHKVVLIEAGEVGEGAQGRNSGFAIDLPHNVGSDLNEIAHAKKYRSLVRSGIGAAIGWNISLEIQAISAMLPFRRSTESSLLSCLLKSFRSWHPFSSV